MATPDALPEIKMDAANLYREETISDRKVGSIRRLTPVRPDGSTDDKRKLLYLGQTQLMTPVGALPLAFEIDAATLEEAVSKFAAAAKVAVERAIKELRDYQREAASSIVIPDRGAGGLGGPGGLPGGGKIQLR
jgi:hypothetical protein